MRTTTSSQPTSSARITTATLPIGNDIGIASYNGALHTVIGGVSAADGNVVFGDSTGIDVHGIAGVPDNSEIRFNNVGVGKDGTTTLGISGAWALGVNTSDGVIVADNVVGNGESGLALANSNSLIVVRNFVGVDRSGGSQGNIDEGIDLRLANTRSAPRTCWSMGTPFGSTAARASCSTRPTARRSPGMTSRTTAPESA